MKIPNAQNFSKTLTYNLKELASIITPPLYLFIIFPVIIKQRLKAQLPPSPQRFHPLFVACAFYDSNIQSEIFVINFFWSAWKLFVFRFPFFFRLRILNQREWENFLFMKTTRNGYFAMSSNSLTANAFWFLKHVRTFQLHANVLLTISRP